MRIRLRTLLVLVAATLLTVTGAALVDLSRPAGSRTHLARLVEQIGGEGSSALTIVLHRKLEMSLATLSSSVRRRPEAEAGVDVEATFNRHRGSS
jgi:hypothetical protein